MESEIFTGSTSATCLRFWYHMNTNFAQFMGTLNVWKFNLDTKTKTLLWTLRFNQGNLWKEGKIPVTDSSKYTIIFEGIRGISVGDIALDDLEFLPSSNCSIFPSNASPTLTTTAGPTTTTTTFKTTPTTTYTWTSQSQYDCNFENDFCLWQNDTTADFNWRRSVASSASFNCKTNLK